MWNLDSVENFKRIETDIYSVLDNYTGALYDKKAKFYEKLVSNKIYNRIIWGTSPLDYKAFANKAINSAEGIVLDAGCGGLIQTKEIYLHTQNKCVLVDNSYEMLLIARERLASSNKHIPDNIKLIQADVFSLPFHDNLFDTVCSFGMIHLFDKKQEFVMEILRTLKVNGSFYFSSMTTKRAISKMYMHQLRKLGEFGELASEQQIVSIFRHRSLSFKTYMRGSMLFIEGKKHADMKTEGNEVK